jgi:hypothetical protein
VYLDFPAIPGQF